MQKLELNGFDIYFSELSDPRISRTKLYPLIEILFVVLCGSICGAVGISVRVFFIKAKYQQNLRGTNNNACPRHTISR